MITRNKRREIISILFEYHWRINSPCSLLIDSKGKRGVHLSNSKHAKIGLTNFRFSRQAQYTCHILGSQTVDSLKSSFDVVFSRDNRLVSKCSNRGMRGRRRGEVDRLESWQSLDNASIVRATPLEQAFPRVSMVVIESGGKKGMKNY